MPTGSRRVSPPAADDDAGHELAPSRCAGRPRSARRGRHHSLHTLRNPGRHPADRAGAAVPGVDRRDVLRRSSMAKQIVYGDASRQGILRGVNSLANAVKVTLGPRGRNVIIDRKFGSPTITKDGVTVAKEIELKDALENMGAQMVKE